MVKTYSIIDSRVTECLSETGRIFRLYQPRRDRAAVPHDHYQLDEHTLQSALDPDELSRIEIESNHVAIILKSP